MPANVIVPPFTAPTTTVVVASTTVFAFDFPFWETADIVVYKDNVLQSSTLYTVVGLAIQSSAVIEGGYGSGTVTFTTGVSNCTIKIDREVVGDRETQFSRSTPLDMRALNGDLNRLTARQQDLDRLFDRAIVVPYGTTAPTAASIIAAALLADGKQPIDADLTAIAALTSAADKVPYSTGAQTWALADFTAAGRALVDDATAAAQRTTLGSTTVGDAVFIAATAAAARTAIGAVIGADVQAYDADLGAIAALTSAADKAPYATGSGAWALATLTSFARTLIATASNSAFLTALGQIASSFLDFIHTGTGAVTETVQAMGRRVVYSDQFSTVQQAITAAGSGGTIIFPRGGTTTLTAPLLTTGLNNIRLVGHGHTMQSGATRIAGYIDVSGSNNVLVEGFKFDCKQSSMPVYTNTDLGAGNAIFNTPIVGNGVTAVWSNITMRDCVVTGLYTNAVWLYVGTGLTVENCVMDAPVCNQEYSVGVVGGQQWSFVYLQTVAGNVKIFNNKFTGATTTTPALPPGGVFCSATNGQVSIYSNRFEYCGRSDTANHRVGVVDVYGDFDNVSVYGNTATNCLASFMRVSSGSGCKIYDNFVYYHASAEAAEYVIGVFGNIAFSGRAVEDISIRNNLFSDPSNRRVYGVQIAAYDWGRPSKRIRVEGNDFVGGNTSIVLIGPFYDVRLDNNNFVGDLAPIRLEATPGIALTTTYGTEANGAYDRFFARGNSFSNTNAASARGGLTSVLNTATTAFVGYFEISGNMFYSASTGGIGFTTQMLSVTKTNTRTVIRDNVVRGFGYALYLRDMGEALLEGNRFRGWATAPIADDVAYTAFLRNGNRLNSGTLHGSATLVAGTVTIANTEIQTGDHVRITRKSVGGTAGPNLVLGTITNSTSFVVSAADSAGATVATDTSVIFYEIVH